MKDCLDLESHLPGKQWVPSNGSEGHDFIESWCMRCERDRAFRECVPVEECDDDELCRILSASFIGKAVEWRELPDGSLTCVGFSEAQGFAVRCEYTADLFAAGE